MAYTFLKAQGHEIGKSLLEADKLELAKQTLAEAKAKHVKFLLPVDHVVADKVAADARIQHIGEGQPIPPDMMALDIGPKSIEIVCQRNRQRTHHRLERPDGRLRDSRRSPKARRRSPKPWPTTGRRFPSSAAATA